MIFELPDIFFGSHKKRKGITTTAGETVRIYKKGRKSLTTSGFFKKSGDIFFGATSQQVAPKKISVLKTQKPQRFLGFFMPIFNVEFKRYHFPKSTFGEDLN